MAVRAIQHTYTAFHLNVDQVQVDMIVQYMDSTANTEFGETVSFTFGFTDLGPVIRDKLLDAIVTHGATIGMTLTHTDIYYIGMTRGV